MSGVQIGIVTHYFGHIGVAVLTLTEKIAVGETVHFLGHSTDFQQVVASMQVEHKPIQEAKPGDEVAMKVDKAVHANDKVFRITGEG
jgi:translation elongation factor EF-1alpha